jgi:hypothetical protein
MEPYYVFLMHWTGPPKKASVMMGYAQNPRLTLDYQDDQWRLAAVMGPIPTRDRAMRCAESCVERTRGLDAKLHQMRGIAAQCNTGFYDNWLPDFPHITNGEEARGWLVKRQRVRPII